MTENGTASTLVDDDRIVVVPPQDRPHDPVVWRLTPDEVDALVERWTLGRDDLEDICEWLAAFREGAQ